MQTSFTQALGLEHPIIQAPMASEATTVEMVAAVSEAGALGFIGTAYLSPQMIATACRDVRLRTGKPFGINLFAPLPVPDVPRNPDLSLARLAPFHADLGLPPPELPVLAGRIRRSATGGRTWGRCVGVQLHLRHASHGKIRCSSPARRSGWPWRIFSISLGCTTTIPETSPSCSPPPW